MAPVTQLNQNQLIHNYINFAYPQITEQVKELGIKALKGNQLEYRKYVNLLHKNIQEILDPFPPTYGNDFKSIFSPIKSNKPSYVPLTRQQFYCSIRSYLPLQLDIIGLNIKNIANQHLLLLDYWYQSSPHAHSDPILKCLKKGEIDSATLVQKTPLIFAAMAFEDIEIVRELVKQGPNLYTTIEDENNNRYSLIDYALHLCLETDTREAFENKFQLFKILWDAKIRNFIHPEVHKELKKRILSSDFEFELLVRVYNYIQKY
jgi:hypothetical protein